MSFLPPLHPNCGCEITGWPIEEEDIMPSPSSTTTIKIVGEEETIIGTVTDVDLCRASIPVVQMDGAQTQMASGIDKLSLILELRGNEQMPLLGMKSLVGEVLDFTVYFEEGAWEFKGQITDVKKYSTDKINTDSYSIGVRPNGDISVVEEKEKPKKQIFSSPYATPMPKDSFLEKAIKDSAGAMMARAESLASFDLPAAVTFEMPPVTFEEQERLERKREADKIRRARRS